jgi:hypothetical protein
MKEKEDQLTPAPLIAPAPLTEQVIINNGTTTSVATNTTPTVIKMKTADIDLTHAIQTRVRSNPEIVEEYAELMRENVPFPRIRGVQGVDGIFRLVDGFHRLEAAKLAGIEEIDVEVWQGDRHRALELALKANNGHGLRRTNADKRRSLEIAWKEYPEWTSNRVAELCGVHGQLAHRVREEMVAQGHLSDSSNSKRVGRDSKNYPEIKEKRTASGSSPAEGQSAPTKSPVKPVAKEHTSPSGSPPAPCAPKDASQREEKSGAADQPAAGKAPPADVDTKAVEEKAQSPGEPQHEPDKPEVAGPVEKAGPKPDSDTAPEDVPLREGDSGAAIQEAASELQPAEAIEEADRKPASGAAADAEEFRLADGSTVPMKDWTQGVLPPDRIQYKLNAVQYPWPNAGPAARADMLRTQRLIIRFSDQINRLAAEEPGYQPAFALAEQVEAAARALKEALVVSLGNAVCQINNVLRTPKSLLAPAPTVEGQPQDDPEATSPLEGNRQI